MPRTRHKRLSLNRRAVLQAGFGGIAGLAGMGGLSGLPNAFAAEHRKAKACIFIFAWGGPSQLDTFDMKPNAPVEVRGEFSPIDTVVPGLQICEHFKLMSQRMDKVGLIRSLTHTDPAHLSSAHATLTGHLAPVVNSDADPPSEKDTPHLGAMLSQLTGDGRFQTRKNRNASLPKFVTLPWKALHPAAPGGKAPGQHGGWLGQLHDPFLLTGDPNHVDWKVPALTLSDGVSPDRLFARQQLLNSIQLQQQRFKRSASGQALDANQSRALDLLASSNVRKAFDLHREPDNVRDRYGRNIHGQCVLLARRLIEHGVPMVSVNWHQDHKNFWDTHGNNFNRLKNDLIPPSDRALAALLDDLSERGMLDETLICWVGEFGRKPQISPNNAGREHWPHSYFGLLAGGGIRGGSVYGSSDKIAAHPATNPVSPADYAATVLHSLGIPAETTLKDRTGRPHSLYAGQPILDLFG